MTGSLLYLKTVPESGYSYINQVIGELPLQALIR
jgi:hypothetical protein